MVGIVLSSPGGPPGPAPSPRSASICLLVPAGVELVITDGEPTRLIEAWTGTALAVVVEAVRAEPPHPGRVHRFVVDRPGVGAARPASSHGFGLDDAIALALALDRCRGA
jgi:hydrogenase maturation protease